MSTRPHPTDLLPTPHDYGIDMNEISNHHSLPDIIHRFPTAEEYERLHRKRETRNCRVLIGFGILTVVILVVALFSKPPSYSKGSADESVIDHSGYSVISATHLPEIQADLVVYYHKKTYTEVMTLVPDDIEQDSVFGISFRTLPESDNGVAHILMRSVLDGSKKFPLKDPFDELRRGSLQTYLKQFIFGDRTVYTCASRNSKDFSNLIAVNLDAVFDPSILQEHGSWIFRQEGWRLEKRYQKYPNKEAQYRFNGVVLETQKGAYSDPDLSIHKYAHRALFPDTQYNYDNSGLPEEIVSVTRASLIEYHQKFYHPSNAQVFLYGPLEDVTEGLKQVDDYVSAYDLNEDVRENSSPKWQDKINKENSPREIHEYASTLENGDYRVMMSWLINDRVMDAKTEIAWRMLNYMLIESPTGILRNRLETSGKGREVIGGGLNTDLMQWTFSVGMKGVGRGDVKKVEGIITDTLAEINQTAGFRTDEISAAFNSVLLQLKDHATGVQPRGISIMFMALTKWTYDGRGPEDAFTFSDAIGALLAEIKQNGSQFFITLLRDHLIDNGHKVIVQLFPDNHYVEGQLKADQARIDRISQKIKAEDFSALLDETDGMILKQNTADPPAVINTIPHLTLDDIDPVTRPNKIKLRVLENILVAETNVKSSFGILYVDFGLDLGNVEFYNMPLLPLISRLFLETGTKLWREDQLANAIGKDSGGIFTEIMVEEVRPAGSDWKSFLVTDESHFATKFFFRGKCLADSLSQYFELLGQIIWFGAKFNQAKTIEILEDMIEKLTEKLGKNGDEFVGRRIEARYSKKGLIRERLEGISSLQYLIQARDDAKGDWADFVVKLDQVRNAIVEGNRNGMVISLTGEADLLNAAQSSIMVFLKDIIPDNDRSTRFQHPSTYVHPWVPQIRQEQTVMAPVVDEGIEYPETISHVGKGGQLYAIWEPIDGAASVVSKYLEDGYLHDYISKQGGATDVHCHIEFRSGTIKFMSYRDPHIGRTLDIYDQASVFLGQSILTTETLPDEAIHAIIGTIAELDGSAPQPNKIGWDFLIEYIREETSDIRQLWRDQILNTSRIDFVEFIKHMANLEDPSIAVIASNEAIQRANATSGIVMKHIYVIID